MVSADSQIYKMSDLEGKKINPGIPSSDNDQQIRKIMEILNIKPDWYVGSPDDAIKAMKDRRIDGYIKYAAGMDSLDASTLDLKSRVPIRIIPFSEKEKTKSRRTIHCCHGHTQGTDLRKCLISPAFGLILALLAQ